MIASLKPLFAAPYRGNLLDVLVFLLNLGLAPWLGDYLLYLFRTADTKTDSSPVLGLLGIAALVLPILGASLKRWHTHQRLGKRGATLMEGMGCLFSPLFYFPLTLVIVSGILAGLAPILFPGADQRGGLFVVLSVLGVGVSIAHTVVVYRYFTPPSQNPSNAFFRSPISEVLGDICLSLNMMLYQVVWNALSSASLGPLKDFEDFAGRVFFLTFISLLIYFPPRMIYLVEDLRRPLSWLTLFLANLPMMVRLFGYG